jgi:hypothetical protein
LEQNWHLSRRLDEVHHEIYIFSGADLRENKTATNNPLLDTILQRKKEREDKEATVQMKYEQRLKLQPATPGVQAGQRGPGGRKAPYQGPPIKKVLDATTEYQREINLAILISLICKQACCQSSQTVYRGVASPKNSTSPIYYTRGPGF